MAVGGWASPELRASIGKPIGRRLEPRPLVGLFSQNTIVARSLNTETLQMADQSIVTQKLAIDGGPKAVTNKLVGWPKFDENAIKAVEGVLRSGKVNYWTGPKEWSSSSSPSGREQVRHQRGRRHGRARGLAAGIGPGDEVIVPSYVHRHQLLRGQAGAFRSCRREPGRPLHQHQSPKSSSPRAPRRSSPSISTATSVTWTRSTPLPRSTTCL